jgi:two-component system NtrC family response regulator
MAKILVIDDDTIVRETISQILAKQGYQVRQAESLRTGIDLARQHPYDLIFLDVQLPDGNGIDKLPEFQDLPSGPEVIIITGYADPDGAELSMKSNAWDYIEKPVSVKAIHQIVSRALQYREEKKNNVCTVTLKREGIIGQSPKIQACLELVARASAGTANILITGETGTGKELFARALHKNSPRAHKNFVVVDCGSLPENLIESLLFGHTQGAFTGAVRTEDGFIKHADGGTLFLDEVGELPPSMQKAFLRVLQERCYTPVGGTHEAKSDFRLVAATHRSLEELVEKSKFREDLLFRLQGVCIDLPPLRERKTDIKELALNYTRFLCESQGIGLKGFSPDFFEILSAYSWPGNIRELYGALEYALANAFFEQTIFPKHLPDAVRIEVARSSLKKEIFDVSDSRAANNPPADRLPMWREYRRELVDKGEKTYLLQLLDRTAGNIKEASRHSGLSIPRIYELLRKHSLST